MHFYGMSLTEVNELPISQFIKLYKSASMLYARKMIDGVKVTNFSNISKAGKESVMKDLQKAAIEFMERKAMDVKEFAKSMAMEILRRG